MIQGVANAQELVDLRKSMAVDKPKIFKSAFEPSKRQSNVFGASDLIEKLEKMGVRFQVEQ